METLREGKKNDTNYRSNKDAVSNMEYLLTLGKAMPCIFGSAAVLLLPVSHDMLVFKALTFFINTPAAPRARTAGRSTTG